MNPQQPVDNSGQVPVTQPATTQKVPFYRSYWIFAAIYLLLPPIIGLFILLTGDIFRKQKDGVIAPISNREKVTLTVVIIVLWIFFVLSSRLSA
jgi:hypothetical protein